MKRSLFTGFLIGQLTFAAGALAGDSIRLPSGTTLDTATFEVRPQWREMFAKGHAFYAPKYGSGSLQGMHARDGTKLDGPSATLYENGKLKILATYPDAVRQGAFRVWDESGRMLLYVQYKDGKKHGVVCLFQTGKPWFIQEWKAGELTGETLVRAAGGSSDDAKKALAGTEDMLQESDRDLRKNLRQWVQETTQDIREQNVDAMKPVHEARARAFSNAHHQADARAGRAAADIVAGAHPRPNSRIGGAAEAASAGYAREAHAAGKGRKAANKAANATLGKAQKTAHKRDAALDDDQRDLYRFALDSLERSR